jgi:hypothetical protein
MVFSHSPCGEYRSRTGDLLHAMRHPVISWDAEQKRILSSLNYVAKHFCTQIVPKIIFCKLSKDYYKYPLDLKQGKSLKEVYI